MGLGIFFCLRNIHVLTTRKSSKKLQAFCGSEKLFLESKKIGVKKVTQSIKKMKTFWNLQSDSNYR